MEICSKFMALAIMFFVVGAYAVLLANDYQGFVWAAIMVLACGSFHLAFLLINASRQITGEAHE